MQQYLTILLKTMIAFFNKVLDTFTQMLSSAVTIDHIIKRQLCVYLNIQESS